MYNRAFTLAPPSSWLRLFEGEAFFKPRVPHGFVPVWSPVCTVTVMIVAMTVNVPLEIPAWGGRAGSRIVIVQYFIGIPTKWGKDMQNRGVARLRWAAGLLLVGTIVVTPVGHARQFEAHAHGEATLLVALEEGTLELAFSSPAVNLVGFEHAPQDAGQKRAVTEAMRTLEKPTTLFEIDRSAECSVVDVEVETSLEHANERHEDERHHQERDEEVGVHADFDARYRFNCSRPARLEGVVIQLFRQFPLIERIEAQSVSPRGQRVQELSAQAARLQL